MRVLFRLDANPTVGYGHFYRCYSIADALISNGASVFFAGDFDPLILDVIISGRMNVVGQSEQLRYDWLIVDHYGILADEEQRLGKLSRFLAVIGDDLNREHVCDLFVLPGIPAGQKWPFREGKETHVLSGKEALLLRKPFFRQLQRTAFSTGRWRIFIAFGGGDYTKLIDLVIGQLASLSNIHIELTVVGTWDRKHCSGQGSSLIIEHVSQMSAEELAAQMDQSDWAVGNGGTMAWERAVRQLPSFIIQTADNQEHVIREMCASGCACLIGHNDDPALEQMVRDGLADPRKVNRKAAEMAGQLRTVFGQVTPGYRNVLEKMREINAAET